MVVQDIRKFPSGDFARQGKDLPPEYISFRDIWSFLRRHLLVLTLMTVLGTALGALYIAETQPTYSSIARIVIDREQARIASQDASTGTIIIEAAEIASEVEIVKSEAIARSVIKEFNEGIFWKVFCSEYFRQTAGQCTMVTQIYTTKHLYFRRTAYHFMIFKSILWGNTTNLDKKGNCWPLIF